MNREALEYYKKTHKWPRGLKKRLLERDGKGCVICESQQHLSIHHIIESRENRRKNGACIRDNYIDREASRKIKSVVASFSLDGTVLLCGSCHGKIHTTPEKSRFKELFYKIIREKRSN